MNKALVSCLKKIKNAIKIAAVTLVSDDSSDFPAIQVAYNEKTTSAVRLSPYGLDSNPPTGALCLLMSSQAQEAVKFGITSDLVNRKKDLAEGEVCLYNTLTQSVVHMKADGSIEVKGTDGAGGVTSTITMSSEGIINLNNMGGADVNLNSTGLISIQNGSEDLNTLLQDLVTQVNAIVTLGGPTSQSVSPGSQSAISAVATRIATLLE